MKPNLIILCALVLLLSGCGISYIKAEITTDQGLVATYSGPKDVSMEAGDIKYSGVKPGFFEDLLKFFAIMALD